jgi:putative aldouronate transport system permease protein
MAELKTMKIDHGVKAGKKDIRRTLSDQKQLILMSVPFLFYIFTFAYLPLWGWTMAFQNYSPVKSFWEQDWVGWQQFQFLFFDENFLKVLRNTICMSVINTVLGFVAAITLALLLNEIKHVFFKRTVQTISYLPHFLSGVIVAALVANCFSIENGIINNLLMNLHVIRKPLLWLSEGKYFWGIIGAAYVWKEVGWNTIIYLAAIAAIDPALYEAAAVDGANRYHKMLHITLPGIKSTFFILLIMAIGNILNAGFEMQYLLGNPMVLDWSETIDIFTLRFGMQIGNYSLATAAGIFKSVVNITLLLLANYAVKLCGEERLL